MAVHEITHPLIAHKLGLMRYAKISSKDFRELASEVGNLLTYEATRTLPTERATIKRLLTGFIDSIANKSGWRELVAGVDESNIASLKLLEKLGFVKQSMNEQRVVFYQYGLKNNSQSEE